MPITDFVEGYLLALRWCGFRATYEFGRDITKSDIDSLNLTELRAELATFWSKHAAAIETAAGIPDLRRNGVRVNTSAQAGHALACIQTRRLRNFHVLDWGDTLVTAMKASADALDSVIIEVVNGALMVRRRTL